MGPKQRLNEAIADTGPILHLDEIGSLYLLKIFPKIYASNQVLKELKSFAVNLKKFKFIEPKAIEESRIKNLAKKSDLSKLHEADISVLALADELKVKIILTDDLHLREKSKDNKLIPVGTIGIIFKSYTSGLITR